MSHESHHIIPFKTLATVFASLIGLTVLTVVAAQLPLGPLDMPVAILIAVVKASLVVMFFMALKYDKPVNSLTFSVGTLFVVIFITFTLFDTAFRGDLGDVSAETVDEITQQETEASERQKTFSAEQMAVSPADYEALRNGESSDTSAASDTTASDTTETTE
ncbi:oxidase [Longibacter salinarum]|uniref:Oxidase n=1 Tax=Longibacter salinarum TaxID=1850348 RepID=A0A2A8D0A6_9BACT|nr:cytochrome C oxidase subunit IV family protein [Longibacter salinarum]PEN14365.1 oxidase [Longibacter salinarum]